MPAPQGGADAAAMRPATRIPMLGLVVLLAALAAGCGGSHRTMASVTDCLHEQGATIVSTEPAPAQQDPDVALLMDGYLGTIWGSIKRASFSVFVTETAAYASAIPSGSETDALLPVEPCVTGIASRSRMKGSAPQVVVAGAMGCG